MAKRKKSRDSFFNSHRYPSVSDIGGHAVSLKIESLFQPDILLPAQYQSTYQSRFRLEPERVLMLAVLQDAVVCFQEHLTATLPKSRSLFVDAEQWIFDEDRSYFFSFENICAALGFDPVYLRQGLTRWKEAALSGVDRKQGRKRLAS